MKIKQVLELFFRRAFAEIGGSWGVSLTLDVDGNVIDDWEEMTQTVYVYQKKEVKEEKES